MTATLFGACTELRTSLNSDRVLRNFSIIAHIGEVVVPHELPRTLLTFVKTMANLPLQIGEGPCLPLEIRSLPFLPSFSLLEVHSVSQSARHIAYNPLPDDRHHTEEAIRQERAGP